MDLVPWHITLVSTHRIRASNLSYVTFPVHKNVQWPKYFALFQDVDNPTPHSPIVAFEHPFDIVVLAGHSIAIQPKKIIIETTLDFKGLT